MESPNLWRNPCPTLPFPLIFSSFYSLYPLQCLFQFSSPPSSSSSPLPPPLSSSYSAARVLGDWLFREVSDFTSLARFRSGRSLKTDDPGPFIEEIISILCGGSIVFLNGWFIADDSSAITIIGGVMRKELGERKWIDEGEVDQVIGRLGSMRELSRDID